MAEGPTTPDLAGLVRGALESAAGGDFDLMLSFYRPDSVWDMSQAGLGTYRGLAAIRGFLEDWNGAFEDYQIEPVHVLDLGSGVTLFLFRASGRPVGSSSHVQLHYASVAEWTEGLIARVTQYTDIDEARAAAERLAQERG
jgi:ketosteroid isomerase-like protein